MDKKIKPGTLIRYFADRSDGKVGLLIRIYHEEKLFSYNGQPDYLCEILPRGEAMTIKKLLSGIAEVTK